MFEIGFTYGPLGFLTNQPFTVVFGPYATIEEAIKDAEQLGQGWSPAVFGKRERSLDCSCFLPPCVMSGWFYLLKLQDVDLCPELLAKIACEQVSFTWSELHQLLLEECPDYVLLHNSFFGNKSVQQPSGHNPG